MARRSLSASPPARDAKRIKLDHLTSEDFRNGVVLAPMVRSGAFPSRLYALKHGAKLVWAPEIVDKAILHAERVVDPVTGVVSYNGKSKAMFTTHPVEKPYLIYQLGSADPDLALQAAQMVLQDISGIDLNCGCPKPFSTHAGMGAALLSTPDLLCSILTKLRQNLPENITVSAKIRLLSDQKDTLELVRRIVETGITNLTVHCRTRNMRPRERALIERLREIVEFVEGLGKGVSVIANGDCVSFEDAKRVKRITGAHSVMIATAAESNPTCFAPVPLTDLEKTLVPPYIRMCKYLDNHWSNTKWCVAQFKGPHPNIPKPEHKAIHDAIAQAKSYDDAERLHLIGPEGKWDGEDVFAEIVRIIEGRKLGTSSASLLEDEAAASKENTATEEGVRTAKEVTDFASTPQNTENPEPPSLAAPLGVANELRVNVPAAVSGVDPPTPTLGGGIPLSATGA
ncbi:FMN-linked oxidoreductase [Neolentinus lepideus HHB14362 ss-1]|uniref:FMN-linked oxidoreductase n=1 Tax=Neolentinus lepideus HHB14362 ss-1 TaxID=1314782 RepID=A0A165QNB4_9AGAM|nr:FMN-linked oxidoreductase [Neolentinus lepideus HHB14362 ss-1]